MPRWISTVFETDTRSSNGVSCFSLPPVIQYRSLENREKSTLIIMDSSAWSNKYVSTRVNSKMLMKNELSYWGRYVERSLQGKLHPAAYYSENVRIRVLIDLGVDLLKHN